MNLPFGTVAEFVKPQMPVQGKDDMARTQTGVVVGRDINGKSIDVWILENNEIVNRKNRSVKKINLTTDIIKLIEAKYYAIDIIDDMDLVLCEERSNKVNDSIDERINETITEDEVHSDQSVHEEDTTHEDEINKADQATNANDNLRIRYPTRAKIRKDYSQLHKRGFLTLKQCKAMFPTETQHGIHTELKQLIDLEFADPVHNVDENAKHKRVLTTSMLVKPKIDPVTGKLKNDIKNNPVKGRFITHGNRTNKNLYHKQERSSPTAKVESFLTVLNIASYEHRKMFTADVPGAYIQVKIKNRHYIIVQAHLATIICEIKPEWKKFLRPDGTLLLRLNKALYGLPESSKLWYEEVTSVLYELGYQKSPTDDCVFQKEDPTGKITLLIYVDDLYGSFTSYHLRDEIMNVLNKKYGDCRYCEDDYLKYIGFNISQVKKDGSIYLHQYDQIKKLIPEDIGTCQFPYDKKLLKTKGTDPIDKNLYLSKLMKLMYIAKRCRPDILFAVSYLATKSKSPTENDLRQVFHIYKYLNGSQSHQVKINPSTITLEVFSDRCVVPNSRRFKGT